MTYQLRVTSSKLRGYGLATSDLADIDVRAIPLGSIFAGRIEPYGGIILIVRDL